MDQDSNAARKTLTTCIHVPDLVATARTASRIPLRKAVRMSRWSARSPSLLVMARANASSNVKANTVSAETTTEVAKIKIVS